MQSRTQTTTQQDKTVETVNTPPTPGFANDHGGQIAETIKTPPRQGQRNETNLEDLSNGDVWIDQYTGTSSAVGGLLLDATDLVSDLVDAVLGLPGVDLGHLEDIQVKFDLWADGVEVTSGRLDNLIVASQELKESLYIIWLSFLRYLIKDSRTSFYQTIIAAYFGRIDSLIEKLTAGDNPHHDDRKEEECRHPPTNDDLQNQVTKFILDFDTFREKLLRIAPFLADFLRDYEHRDILTFLDEEESDDELGRNTNIQQFTPHKDLKPQDWYQNGIKEAFPQVDENVSQIIARELWELYRNIRLALYYQVGAAKERDPGTITELDSTYESMQKSLAESLAERAPKQIQLALSDIASELSSSSCQLKDRPQVPPPPQGVVLGPDVIFKCQFCLEMVSNVDTTKKWRKHVLSDIRPYFCTFSDCPSSSIRYKTKTEWMAHEVQYHRLVPFWKCNSDKCEYKADSETKLLNHLIADHSVSWQTSGIRGLLNSARSAELNEKLSFCKICRKDLPSRVSRLASHIGRHLENFALPILSRLDDREVSSSQEEYSDDSSDETAHTQHISDPSTASTNSNLRPRNPNREARFLCPELNCKENFISKREFGRHMVSTHRIKFFKCQFCGKRFARFDSLRTHQSKSNRCIKYYQNSQHSIPELQRATSVSPLDTINRNRQNRYPCTECKASFTTYEEFGTHMFSEHQIIAFKCQCCNTKFARGDYLKFHLKDCKKFIEYCRQNPLKSIPELEQDATGLLFHKRNSYSSIKVDTQLSEVPSSVDHADFIGENQVPQSKIPEGLPLGFDDSPREVITGQQLRVQDESLDLPTSSSMTKEKEPVSFDDAISYVNKVKETFYEEPHIYREFLEILQIYQTEGKSIAEVNRTISNLFAGHPELLEGFKRMLPPKKTPGDSR